MPDQPKPRDVTGTVPLDDAGAVAGAVEGILARCFGAATFDRDLLYASYGFAERLFAGEHEGYLACDMPYHDLRHSLDASLVAARLVAGHQRLQARGPRSLAPEHGLLAVLLGLLHDTGFLRTAGEASLCGPQLALRHEYRSVEFAQAYLEATSLAAHASLSQAILATRLGLDPARLFPGRDDHAVVIARVLGGADLLAQVADPWYPERCFYHLYPELVLGGADRECSPDGTETLLFRNALDLLGKTPGFVAHVVRPRLDGGLGRVQDLLAAHFDGADPYAEALAANVARCVQIVADDGVRHLRGVPVTTTRDLAPIYRAPMAS